MFRYSSLLFLSHLYLDPDVTRYRDPVTLINKTNEIMAYFLLFISLFIVCISIIFILANIQKAKLLKTNVDIKYSSFGKFTSRLEFKKNFFESDSILVNSDTGKILIGGRIFNMSEITKSESRTSGGYMYKTYEDKTYIKTNTGNAIGRAVVGGVVAGGVGAIVGASTANKEIKTKKVEKNMYISKSYKLYLEVNNNIIWTLVETDSEQKIMKVVSFINSEIANYKKASH